MSYGIVEGGIRYSAILYHTADDFNSGKGINLTKAIRQLNISYNILGKYSVLMSLNGVKYDEYLSVKALSDKPIVHLAIGGNVQSRSRLFAVVSVERTVDPLTKFSIVNIELAPYEKVYSPKFSTYMEGSYKDVISSMIDLTFDKSYASLKPVVNYGNFSSSTRIYNLIQRQNLMDYCEELRKNVVSDEDLTSIMIWDTFSEINIDSFKNIVTATATDVILSSSESINQFAAKNITDKNGNPIYYAVSYDSVMDFDVAKYHHTNETKIYLPNIDRGNLPVFNNINSDDVLETKIFPSFAGNNDISYLISGYSKAFSSQLEDLLTCSLSTLTVYYPDIPFEPGAVINLMGTSEHGNSYEKLLIVGIKTDLSNTTGVQLLSAIKLSTVEEFLNNTSNQATQSNSRKINEKVEFK